MGKTRLVMITGDIFYLSSRDARDAVYVITDLLDFLSRTLVGAVTLTVAGKPPATLGMGEDAPGWVGFTKSFAFFTRIVSPSV